MLNGPETVFHFCVLLCGDFHCLCNEFASLVAVFALWFVGLNGGCVCVEVCGVVLRFVLHYCTCACVPFLNCVHLGLLEHVRRSHHTTSGVLRFTAQPITSFCNPSCGALHFLPLHAFARWQKHKHCLACGVQFSSAHLVFCFQQSRGAQSHCFCPTSHTTKFIFVHFLILKCGVRVFGTDHHKQASERPVFLVFTPCFCFWLGDLNCLVVGLFVEFVKMK